MPPGYNRQTKSTTLGTPVRPTSALSQSSGNDGALGSGRLMYRKADTGLQVDGGIRGDDGAVGEVKGQAEGERNDLFEGVAEYEEAMKLKRKILEGGSTSTHSLVKWESNIHTALLFSRDLMMVVESMLGGVGLGV